MYSERGGKSCPKRLSSHDVREGLASFLLDTPSAVSGVCVLCKRILTNGAFAMAVSRIFRFFLVGISSQAAAAAQFLLSIERKGSVERERRC